MNFLAPLFLAGAAVVVLPVLFHLARRTARDRQEFSSLRFLRPTPPRITRRNRLEHWLLLLLRCGVIALLALGFARPFFRPTGNPPLPADPARRIVMLLDTSASMRRDGLWAEARSRAETVARRCGPADQLAMFRFDRQLAPLVNFADWTGTATGDRTALVSGRLAGVEPGWSATALDQALIRAAELLTAGEDGQARFGRRQIVLISDLQSGSRVGGLQGYEWPRGIELVVERVDARVPGNAAPQLATESTEASLAMELSVRVRVHNAADSRRDQFRLGWARDTGAVPGTNIDLYVPAGQSRMVTLPVPPAASGADRVLLSGDEAPFDDTLYVVPPSPAAVNALYWGHDNGEDAKQPRYFLERAFQETRRHAVRVVPIGSGEAVAPAILNAAPLLIVTSPLDDRGRELVQGHLAAGHVVLVAPSDAATVNALAAIPACTGLSAEEGRFANHGLLGELDFQHPLLAPFADPRFSDFTRIHFWKYRKLDLGAVSGVRVVARFDNGDPALAEFNAGRGRVVLLASGWHPTDSQLALSSKFVPLLYALLDWSGAGPGAPVAYLVGDRVPLRRDPAAPTGATTVIRPDGTAVNVAADATEFAETTAPGVYRTTGGLQPARFAVNLDPAEGRTPPLLPDDLERLGVPLAKPTAQAARVVEQATRLRDAEIESRQKLWRWAILATLGLLLIETWLAGWTARATPPPSPAAS